MFLMEFMLSFLLAALVTLFLIAILKQRAPGPLQGAVFLFVLLLLSIWAFGAWFYPIGPEVFGVAWVGFVMAGILLAVLFAALGTVSPQVRKPKRQEMEPSHRDPQTIAVALAMGIFFYFAVAVLLIAVLVRYFTAIAELYP